MRDINHIETDGSVGAIQVLLLIAAGSSIVNLWYAFNAPTFISVVVLVLSVTYLFNFDTQLKLERAK